MSKPPLAPVPDAAICDQPHCALRKEGVDADQLADVIKRLARRGQRSRRRT